MEKMFKKDLVSQLASSACITKKAATEFVDAFISAVSDAMVNNESLVLASNFKLYTKVVNGKKMRNPKTGEPVMTGDKVVVRCKFSKELVKELNG